LVPASPGWDLPKPAGDPADTPALPERGALRIPLVNALQLEGAGWPGRARPAARLYRNRSCSFSRSRCRICMMPPGLSRSPRGRPAPTEPGARQRSRRRKCWRLSARRGWRRADQQEALAVEQRRVGQPLILFEETVLFERELVELIAKLLVLLERFRWRHGGGGLVLDGVLLGRRGAGVAGCFAARDLVETPRRHAARSASSERAEPSLSPRARCQGWSGSWRWLGASPSRS